ncbi:hypothetical protein QJS10_CPB19g00830 [Acorus calamus]|uniref:Uncharacterized protein n=1 Tax=Acorus calamus TaxID=4465 RepID=A0AAV9CGD7_ACOCL|nr:hypothetical protein QJS10_CPB19g00830 [Acorus calamus]
MLRHWQNLREATVRVEGRTSMSGLRRELEPAGSDDGGGPGRSPTNSSSTTDHYHHEEDAIINIGKTGRIFGTTSTWQE